MKKQGEILLENVVFIILNLVFISLLILFIFKQSTGSGSLEQLTAKQIALLIDSAKFGSLIFLDIEDGKKVDEKWFDNNFQDSVKINGNEVFVKFSENGGYSYSFFNDVNAVVEVTPQGKLIVLIRQKNGA